MKSHTEYLYFNTKKRREFVLMTDRIVEVVAASGVQEGLCLVSTKHNYST